MLIWSLKVFVEVLAVCSLAAGQYQKESSKVQDPPCFFNPLCICSKAYPDLGRVTCKDFPLLNIPQQINASKVFTLHLENNGLQNIEPHFFSGTGIFKLEISRNLLREIRKETFAGLERSLWELKLQNNKFRRVPNQSLRYLHKLKLLDLSDNQIRSIKPEDWNGLEDSLKTLILSGNKLTSLRPKTFSVLRRLESLDLSRNTLLELNVFALDDVPLSLTELNLSHNLLSGIPFNQISHLKQLRQLDLSFNLITEVEDVGLDGGRGKLLLDTLRLDYNQISVLPVQSFKYFSFVNRTFFNGNPIRQIEKNAFAGCKIRELHLRDCELNELTIDSFAGTEAAVEVFDLQGNNLTNLPFSFFKGFTSLKSLILRDNFMRKFDFEYLFGDGHHVLDELDISCNQNSVVNFKTWKKLSNIRSLKISRFPDSSLTSNDFPEFFSELEEIEIAYSNIKNLKNHAFKNVRGLRRLDLSENSISTIENEAFSEISHSLTHLSLANGLSSSFVQLPPDAFKDLTNVEMLDLSNNKLRVLPQKSFCHMKRLKMIFLQDNFIEFIPRRTFQGDIHSELNTIQLSFNQLTAIESQTFANLNNLKSLWLNDNRIKTIERRAFANLYQLKNLYLRGNKIMFLAEETFQDLPELEKLDLAYNMLKKFNYNCLDQVGTFSAFTLNLSRNNLDELSLNSSNFDNPDYAPVHINIKALDLSHNNISRIEPGFFKAIEPSITHLYLGHNRLPNVTRNTFGNMMHLQWLDLSFNFLNDLEYDSLANTRSIQIFYLANNYLQEIPKQFFRNFNRLRILDLSNNYLRSLPNNLFNDLALEKLYVSNNQLTKVPLSSFDAHSNKILSVLDVSKNAIMTLPSAEAFAKYQNLNWLNLSKNRLIRIEDGVFAYLRGLYSLDLSHNSDLILDQKGHTFYGLHDTLEDLSLKNLSLSVVPSLYLPSLISLDLSQNNIYTISFEFPHNLSSLQKLELAENKLFKMPPAINGFANLEYIGVSGNPLQTVNFQQSFTLREVDLRNVSLGTIEKGALGKIGLLETLKLTINESTQNLNFPHLLKDNLGLNHLYIEVLQNEGLSLMDRTRGNFSSKFRNLTLVGQALHFLPENLLKSVQSPIFNLALTNTSVKEVSERVFENGVNIRNLTLSFKSNKLNTVGNPNAAVSPTISKKTFLMDFQTSDNDWICDCSIGWIEGWERKRRHYLCTPDSEECFLGSDDLRSSFCSNRKSNTVAELFKSELECGWNSSSKLKRSTVLEFITVAYILPLLYL